ncbi:MAG TPA: glycosyltransferase family 4 protein, partial [Ferruginibacter sp.]|nr:glycosyltransferase family 4 protein [Ferruginibacter sp.]
WWGVLWQYEKWVHQHADMNFFIQENDRKYAIEYYKLDPQRTAVITYGFELSGPPTSKQKKLARQEICSQHCISVQEKILLFNGTLGYKPNLDALDIILNKINPLLLARSGFLYKIVICGSKLPASYHGLVEHKEKNIIYAGFVDDINLYFKGADVFINPVIDGGGIKTKVVEALGYDLSVISTASGAIGIPVEITGGKLNIIADNDWNGFAEKIISLDTNNHIPAAYFEHFYWDNIAAKAAALIN